MNKMEIIKMSELSKIIENNPVGFITRENIDKATGGLLHPRTMANLDSKGDGIKNRFRVGRTVCYPVCDVVDFLEQRKKTL